MHISQAKGLVHRSVEKRVHVPFLFVGSMGIGKSQMMKQVADELDVGLIDLRLAQLEPGDIIGVPRSDERTGRTVWRKPEWWPEEGTKGILHLDELNRAPVDVRQAVFQLVLDRRMHTHVLPDGWFVHASVNPDNGAYQVEQLDQAMHRRFCNIKVTADVEEWVQFWKTRYPEDRYSGLITKFILTDKKMLCINEEFDIKVTPTPDSYRMLYELLSAGVVTPDTEKEVIAGLIGIEGAISLVKFMDKHFVKPVGGKEILEDYKSVKDQVLKQPNDAMYVTITDLLAVIKSEKNMSKKYVDNLAGFLEHCNEETKVSVISKLPNEVISSLSPYRAVVESVRKVMTQIESTKRQEQAIRGA